MADIPSLREAVGSLVRDGDTVALEGFMHLMPFAAGHELIRQGRRNLTLVRMTPDVIDDQLIGAGCARGRRLPTAPAPRSAARSPARSSRPCPRCAPT